MISSPVNAISTWIICKTPTMGPAPCRQPPQSSIQPILGCYYYHSQAFRVFSSRCGRPADLRGPAYAYRVYLQLSSYRVSRQLLRQGHQLRRGLHHCSCESMSTYIAMPFSLSRCKAFSTGSLAKPKADFQYFTCVRASSIAIFGYTHS